MDEHQAARVAKIFEVLHRNIGELQTLVTDETPGLKIMVVTIEPEPDTQETMHGICSCGAYRFSAYGNDAGQRVATAALNHVKDKHLKRSDPTGCTCDEESQCGLCSTGNPDGQRFSWGRA